MDAQIKLGRVWGIPIGLHPTWFLIFIFVTFSLASGYFPAEYPQLPAWAHWGLGALTSILFFASVLAHELGHAWVALRSGIAVKSITLFIFGGAAHIASEPKSAGAEFRIALAGPAVSLGLAGLFGGLFVLDQAVPFLAAPSIYLARINLMLALFNMIPGFPLDGGRVLRALVWRYTGNLLKATRVASISGQVVAFIFMGLGALSLLQGQVFNGLWLGLIGWFLQNAAASAYAQMRFEQVLRDVTVAQVMLPVGRPWDGPDTRVTPEMDLVSALRRMEELGAAHVVVTSGGWMHGILTRDQVIDRLRLGAAGS